MTKFADQLYNDLMRDHGSTLADTRLRAGSRPQFASRRVLLTAGAGGLAVAATAGALAAGGGAPAYALTTSHDGTITLAVYQASGISQANDRLRQLGDDVVVVPVQPGCPSISSLPAPAVLPTDKSKVSVQSTKPKDGSVNSMTVTAQGVPDGDIIVVGAEITPRGTSLVASLTSPPAPSCVSLPAQPSESGPNLAHQTGAGPKVHRAGSGSNVAHVSGSGSNVSRKN